MDSGKKCGFCPTDETLGCAGLDVRRFCELIDPACTQYDPGYREVIVTATRRALADMNLLDEWRREPVDEGAGTLVIPTDCCGGHILPDELGDD